MDVLLASAQSDLRFALEVLIRGQPGVSVVGTATGTEGLLALIGANCPDLVIFDWNLPGRPPAELLTEARALSGRTPIIVLGRDDQARQTAMQAGADDFVVKGDSVDDLVAAIRRQQSGRNDESPANSTQTEGGE